MEINNNLNSSDSSSGISVLSWPALLSCFLAVAGIVVLARAAYGMGSNAEYQDAAYRRSMFLLCSGFVAISCAVAVNKFIE